MNRRIAVAGVALALFALLVAQLLAQGSLVRLDLQLTQFLAAHRMPWVTTLMLGVSRLHETVVLLTATALIAAALAWRGHRRSALLLGVVPTGMLLNVGLKHVFQRARPVLEQPLVFLETYSFPSGHAVASTVFYGALALLALWHVRRPAGRGAAVAGAAAMVALVCASRVYLGAHYLGDVLAGVCVGTAWLAAWTAVASPRREVL